MRFKKYLNELFTQPVELKVDSKWNKYRASFNVANDVYTMTATRLNISVMTDNLTDKELKKFTGYDMKDSAKETEKIKKYREEGRRRIPLSKVWRAFENFFGDHHIWLISFTSKKFGDEILDIRTRKEVAIIYSGIKKSVEEFIRKVKPSFLIIDSKDPKRVKIYKRFVDEIIKRGGYKAVGGLRKFDYGEGETKTKGWLLFSGKMTP